MLWVIIFLEAKACVSFLVRKAAPNSCFAHVEDQDFAHILCKSQGFCGAFVRMHAGMNRLGPKSWHFRMNLVQIHCLRLINSFVTHPIDAVRICVLVQYFVDRFLEHFFNKQIYMHYMSHQKCADLFRMDDHVPRKSWKHCNQNLADDYWFVGTLSELLYISFSKRCASPFLSETHDIMQKIPRLTLISFDTQTKVWIGVSTWHMYRIFLATHLAKVIPSAVVRTFLDRCGKVGMIFFCCGCCWLLSYGSWITKSWTNAPGRCKTIYKRERN